MPKKTMTKAKRYTGPWNQQCPYCLGKRVEEFGHWYEDCGPKWESDCCARCLECGNTWQDHNANEAGCPNCGVYHSFDIKDEPQTQEEADHLGTAIGVAPYYCGNCGAVIDPDTRKVLKVFEE